MAKVELTQGQWYTQLNGATYQILEIRENGDYYAEGTSWEGRSSEMLATT